MSEITYAFATFLVYMQGEKARAHANAVATLLVHIRGCIAFNFERLPRKVKVYNRKQDKNMEQVIITIIPI